MMPGDMDQLPETRGDGVTKPRGGWLTALQFVGVAAFWTITLGGLMAIGSK